MPADTHTLMLLAFALAAGAALNLVYLIGLLLTGKASSDTLRSVALHLVPFAVWALWSIGYGVKQEIERSPLESPAHIEHTQQPSESNPLLK